MKLYLNKLASIFADIKNRNLKALLLYGPNEALAHNIFNRLKKYLQLEVKSLSGAESIKSSNLQVILSTSNLFGSLELIKVTEVGTSLEASAIKILNDNTNNFIVIIAKELATSSSLRKNFEAAANSIGCLACYEEDKVTLQQFITSYVASMKKSIELSASDYLASNFTSREMLSNELNKLSSYIGSRSEITLQDVQVASFGVSVDEIDLLCLDLVKGCAVSYFNRLEKFDFTTVAPIMVVRSFIRLYKNLYYLLAKQQEGKSLHETAKTLKAPIFFKFLSPFLSIAAGQNIENSIKGLNLLSGLEKNIKFSSINTNKLFEQLFFALHS